MNPTSREPEPTLAALPDARRSLVAAAPTIVTRFDRERVVLYAAALLTVGAVIALYAVGYLVPALDHRDAIVNAARADRQLSSGCYLLSLEHANRMQSAYALRFLGMLIGTMVAFTGMMFSIKGLEAGYSLDLNSGSGSASLKTASPGLVLCTLGIALSAAGMLNTSNLTFQTVTSCLQ